MQPERQPTQQEQETAKPEVAELTAEKKAQVERERRATRERISKLRSRVEEEDAQKIAAAELSVQDILDKMGADDSSDESTFGLVREKKEKLSKQQTEEAASGETAFDRAVNNLGEDKSELDELVEEMSGNEPREGKVLGQYQHEQMGRTAEQKAGLAEDQARFDRLIDDLDTKVQEVTAEEPQEDRAALEARADVLRKSIDEWDKGPSSESGLTAEEMKEYKAEDEAELREVEQKLGIKQEPETPEPEPKISEIGESPAQEELDAEFEAQVERMEARMSLIRDAMTQVLEDAATHEPTKAEQKALKKWMKKGGSLDEWPLDDGVNEGNYTDRLGKYDVADLIDPGLIGQNESLYSLLAKQFDQDAQLLKFLKVRGPEQAPKPIIEEPEKVPEAEPEATTEEEPETVVEEEPESVAEEPELTSEEPEEPEKHQSQRRLSLVGVILKRDKK